MATPQESTTTVSGRRCTRSRARTAASTLTSEPAEITPTELTSSTTTEEAQQTQTSAAQAPPSPPASEAQQEAPDVASTTQAAASSAIGTSSAVSSSPARSSVLANLAPSPPAAVAPNPAAEASDTGPVVSAAAEISTAPSTTSIPAPTSSDAIETATPSVSSIASVQPSDPAAPAESSPQSTVQALPEQSISPSQSLPDDQPQQPGSTETGVPSGGSAGIISPDQPAAGDEGGLTLSSGGQTNVGGIVGGVIGGVVGIALISALLFLCLRRRKTRESSRRWQPRFNEKSEGDSALLAKLRAVPEKAKAIPAAIGMLFAKMKGKKSGPVENPYRRHSVRSSISSVYSVRSNGRSRSISEPPSKLRDQLRGFGGRMPSLKRSKTLLQKKQDSLVGAKSPFPGIVEDPVIRNSKAEENPFKDPDEQPKGLLLLNPDPEPSSKTKATLDGLQDQQRGPITPKPTAMSDRGSRDPFASILDELDVGDGSGTPDWLKESSHKRTTSAATALRSHPPSTYTTSIYTTADNPFVDPSEIPPVPTQPLPPNPPARPANAWNPLPSFNATSSAASRESNGSFFFGEPGPSRPTTNMFSNPPRIGRQSDPFDLDRPEVLGFGNVTGRREVRASVTRQNSRSNRASSVPNWVSVDDGPYERASAVPGPLRNGSVRR